MTNTQRWFPVLSVALILAACGQASGPQTTYPPTPSRLTAQAALPVPCEPSISLTDCGDPPGPTDPGGDTVIPGQYIVVLKEDLEVSTAAALPAPPQDPVDSLARQLVAKVGGEILQSFSSVKMFSATLSDAAVLALQAEPAVAYIEPDRTVQLDPPAVDGGDASSPLTLKTASVQLLAPSWGLDRIDQRFRPLDNQYSYSGTAPGVNVYVVDSGISAAHQDFGGRATLDFTAVNDGNGASDCNGHGTHVAGTIGGNTYGVAKEVRLHSVRVFGCGGGSAVSTIVSGFDWVSRNRLLPAVVNASLGGPSAGGQALADAALRTARSGATVVVAAGNNGGNACNVVPASAGARPEVISVGATTIGDQRASFSNYGGCVSMFAPGVNIKSDWIGSDTASNTISGTSMASPHVAGAAALYLQDHPGDSAAQVKRALLAQSSAGLVGNPGPGSPNQLLYTPGGTSGVPTCGVLPSGGSLAVSTSLYSCNGRYELRVQGDGNLVLYRNSAIPLWVNGNSWGRAVDRLVMQGDGNLVLYGPGNVPLWNSPTWGYVNPYLKLQDDGNLMVVYQGRPIWSTGTH